MANYIGGGTLPLTIMEQGLDRVVHKIEAHTSPIGALTGHDLAFPRLVIFTRVPPKAASGLNGTAEVRIKAVLGGTPTTGTEPTGQNSTVEIVIRRPVRNHVDLTETGLEILYGLLREDPSIRDGVLQGLIPLNETV